MSEMRDDENRRALLGRLFRAAVAAADPAVCLPPHLPEAPASNGGRTVVLGAGKAAASMARAVEDNWTGAVTGLVVTRYGYAVRPSRSRLSRPPTRCPIPPARLRRRVFWLLPRIWARTICCWC